MKLLHFSEVMNYVIKVFLTASKSLQFYSFIYASEHVYGDRRVPLLLDLLCIQRKTFGCRFFQRKAFGCRILKRQAFILEGYCNVDQIHFYSKNIRDDPFGSNDFRLILLQLLEDYKIDNSTGFRLRNLAFRYSYFGLAFLSASIALLAF